MITTIGIDIGTSAVKSVLFRTIDGKPEWLGKRVDRLRKRDPMKLATEAFQNLLTDEIGRAHV